METHLKKNIAIRIGLLCLVICYLNLAYASPNNRSIKTYSLCHFSPGLSVCSQNEPCKDGEDEELLKKLCQCPCSFKESLRCVEREGRYVRFCYDNQVCPAGTQDTVLDIVWLIDKIVLAIEECPDGYFQPHRAQCNKACSYRHTPKPFNMVQLHPGNASASEVAYCDSDNGWVSFNDRTFFNISLESGSRMCIKSGEPCQNGMDLLPNGTCAAKCRPGSYRVPVDHFNCKPGVVQTSVAPARPTPTREPGAREKETEKQPTHDPTNTHLTKYVTLMVIFAVAGIAGPTVVILFKSRRRGEPHELHNPGTENRTLLGQQDSNQGTVPTVLKETNNSCTIIKAKHVVVNQYGDTKDNCGDEEGEEEETQVKEVA